MQRVMPIRTISLALAALALAGAATTSASFLAARPGADLSPLSGAEHVISILQGNETILWTSLSGSVNSYSAVGWPSTTAGNELGGALVIERPEDGLVGVIDLGEKPQSLTFHLDS